MNYGTLGEYDDVGVSTTGKRVWYPDYSTIDWVHDHVKDTLRLEYVRKKGHSSLDSSQAWLILSIVGVLAGSLASGMHYLSNLIQDYRLGTFNHWGSYNSIVYIVSGLALALLSAFLTSFDTHAVGSGIPQLKTILSGFVIRGFLGIKTLVIKSIALILIVSSGFLVGMQGPMIHISCSIGNIVCRQFSKYGKNEAKKREILSAACAAGVAVAFGAPIGGILFSLEELSSYFPIKTMWRSFYCALISALTLQFFDPFGKGRLALFQVSFEKHWSLPELLPFTLLAIFGGLFGTVFIQLYEKIQLWNSYWMIVAVSLFSSLTAIFDLTRIGNSQLVALLFSDCTDSWLCQDSNIALKLLYTLFIKISLMLLCCRLQVPGGIFLPSMVIGGITGRLMAIGLQALNFHVEPGVYALIGSAACLSGTTRMTVSLTVILFELTGALSFVLPIMATIMISKFVADAFGRNSFYDQIIQQNNYPYLNHKRSILTNAAIASDIMTFVEPLKLNEMYSIKDLNALLSLDKDEGFPIVKDDNILMGYIAQTELEHALETVRTDHIIIQQLDYYDPVASPQVQSHPDLFEAEDISQWVNLTPVQVPHLTSVAYLVELFMKLGCKTVVVTQQGFYVGLIQKKTFLGYIQQTNKR